MMRVCVNAVHTWNANMQHDIYATMNTIAAWAYSMSCVFSTYKLRHVVDWYI